jgi:hypothetical protein
MQDAGRAASWAEWRTDDVDLFSNEKIHSIRVGVRRGSTAILFSFNY